MPDSFPRPMPIWSAPLVPVALASTAGILVDRYLIVPLLASACVGVACFLAWLFLANTSNPIRALAFLLISVAALGATYHHWRRHHLDAGDVSHLLDQDAQPTRLRGVLTSAPTTQVPRNDPLRSLLPTKSSTRFVLRVTHRQDLATRRWFDASGLTQVTLVGRVDDITVGDEIEALGRLALPGGPMNAGEFDYANALRDQGITSTFTVVDTDELTRTRRGWPTSLFGWLAVLRGWGQQTLERDFVTQHQVAAALLLGEGSSMTGDAWEQYMRTGVVHVLAISGQHLVVLAGFLWLLTRGLGIRRRRAALAIALLLIAYALLTGGRPPVMRAAWMVAAYVGGILLKRPVSPANTFALGWIGVVAINPTDIFTAGCQLSFLAVAVLVWGMGHWNDEPTDALTRLIDEARPWYARLVRWVGRWILVSYALNAAVWLAVAPLIAANHHLVSPIALLIGPLMVVLTSLALLTGFLYFLFAAWFVPLAMPFAWITQGSLLGCEWLVSLGQKIPYAYFFVSDIPVWWLGIFYVGLLLSLALPIVWQHARWALAAGLAWLLLPVVLQAWPQRPGELRCTFVAVGHGGCTVIETPNGHVIVYDAGATTGPDVTRRHIAPFLWSRGIRRIDALILSHADLDHFNGVVQLLDRFTVARAVSTPTFAERGNQAMETTLAALDTRSIKLEVVQRGQRWNIDGVSFEVLHPPAVGPDGKENARSLVLHVTHGDWSMLLTGDLEEAGLVQVLQIPARKVDVLMAPHHGSDRSNIPALAQWARPKLVVSSQAMPISDRVSVAMYEKIGAKFLSTWPHGTITIRPAAAMPVETYRTKLSLQPF
jgi:competence protein ComEC